MGTGCISAKNPRKSASCLPLNTKSPSSHSTRYSQHQTVKSWTNTLIEYSSTSDNMIIFSRYNPTKFKSMLMSGPPTQLRWSAWKALLSYRPISIPTHSISPYFLNSIDQDISRTFPNNIFFQDSENLRALREVLINTVRLNPALGYTQGMNFIAGVLLQVSDFNINESSRMMHIFLNNLEGKGLFEPGFPKLNELTKQFSLEFSKKLPELFEWFQNIEFDDNLWLTKWFMTLFSYSFEFNAVVRLWDLIFVCGLESLIHLALSILTTIKKDVLGKEIFEVIEYFKDFSDACIDFEAIIAATKARFKRKVKQEYWWKDTDLSEGLSDSDVELQMDVRKERRRSATNFNKSDKKSLLALRKMG